tara:strand:+ start:654 stop:794 length:141 start_codon:yes stop_codon:yes gene_type:complete
MKNICVDIVNGTLLVHEDDHTIEMVLHSMYDDMKQYEAMGVIIGKA